MNLPIVSGPKLKTHSAALLMYLHIGDIERGERNPSLKNISAIAEALGVDISELFLFGSRHKHWKISETPFFYSVVLYPHVVCRHFANTLFSTRRHRVAQPDIKSLLALDKMELNRIWGD